ncbi:hypothetical protein J6590_108144, partial [Homalodisca vitripennis]
ALRCASRNGVSASRVPWRGGAVISGTVVAAQLVAQVNQCRCALVCECCSPVINVRLQSARLVG